MDGKSMFPALLPGDQIIVKKIPLRLIKIGDIMVYKVPSSLKKRLIVHRVVGNLTIRKKILFFTIGDLGYNPDVVSSKEIIGIAVARIRNNEITEICRKITFLCSLELRLRFLLYGLRSCLGNIVKRILRVSP